MGILAEDECNDTYGRERMHQALLNKKLKPHIYAVSFCLLIAKSDFIRLIF